MMNDQNIKPQTKQPPPKVAVIVPTAKKGQDQPGTTTKDQKTEKRQSNKG
jgi:hypothetical protein